jgi:hypothetical protein
LGVVADLPVHQHRSEQDEVAELGVNDVAVDAHLSQPGCHGDRLVADDPDLLREGVHVHRETHRGSDGTHTDLPELGRYGAAHFVRVVTGVVKLEVGDRASRSANVLPVHSAHEADEHFHAGKRGFQILLLVRNFGSIDRHEPHIVSARVQT